MFTTIVAAVAFILGTICGAAGLLVWWTRDRDKAEARQGEREELDALYRRQERLYQGAMAHVGEKR